MICQEWPSVVSWTKGLRYRPNLKMTLAMGVSGHVSRTTGKDKETPKAVLVRSRRGRMQKVCRV